MYSNRNSYNELPIISTSARGSLTKNNLVKNLQRAVSLNSSSLPNLPKHPQQLISSLSQSPRFSPTLLNSPKVLNAKLPSLPSLSATVQSSRPHGIVKAYCANTHKGIVRSTNEDRVMIISKISKPAARKSEKWPICSFFGIYDGHMGKDCCNYLRDNLHSFIINDPNFPSDPIRALTNSFAKAEEGFIKYAVKSKTKAGSCAIIVLIVGKFCYLANLGDSRAVLSKGKLKKVSQISRDHVPHDDDERKRINLAGAEVVFNKHPGNPKQLVSRIMHAGISVSRCFGDVDAKLKELGGIPNALIAVPEVSVFKIRSSTDFIVLGSDGLFEKIKNQEMAKMIWQSSVEAVEKEVPGKLAKGAEKIMIEAMVRNATDNMTAVVIAFKNFCNELESGLKP